MFLAKRLEFFRNLRLRLPFIVAKIADVHSEKVVDNNKINIRTVLQYILDLGFYFAKPICRIVVYIQFVAEPFAYLVGHELRFRQIQRFACSRGLAFKVVLSARLEHKPLFFAFRSHFKVERQTFVPAVNEVQLYLV